MKVTEKEKEVLKLIRDSEYINEANPVGVYTWTEIIGEYFSGGNTKVFSGVMSNLVQKGLVEIGRESGRDAACCITQVGFDAVKE